MAFVLDWAKSHPSSPYALAARADLYLTSSGNVRGQDWGSRTYPEALEKARRYNELGYRDARRAYELAPDYVPASDLVMLFARLRGGEGIDEKFVATVMAATPSRGSLERAVSAHNPRWGGDFAIAVSLCNAFADKVADSKGFDENACLAYATLIDQINDREQRDWAVEQAGKYDFPEFAQTAADALMQVPTDNELTRKTMERYFADPENLDVGYANFLDQVFRVPAGQPPILPRVEAAEVAMLERVLKTDPFKPDLLRKQMVLAQKYAEKTHQTPQDVWSGAARNLLAVSPYDPAVWRDLAYSREGFGVQGDYSNDPLYHTAIAYSNQGPDFLGGYGVVLWVRLGNALGKAYNKPLSAWSEAEEFRALDQQQICTLTRVVRLYAVQCPSAGPSVCRMDKDILQWQSLVDKAASFGLCGAERSARLEEIVFTPMDPGDAGLPPSVLPPFE